MGAALLEAEDPLLFPTYCISSQHARGRCRLQSLLLSAARSLHVVSTVAVPGALFALVVY